VDVVSAADMHAAATEAFEGADAAICAAAVADYTPKNPAGHKLKKATEHLDRIELEETKDILAGLSADKGSRVVVGFAAETDDLIAHATDKLERKGCDLIVANDVSRADSTFGSDTDRVAFVYPDHVEQLETLPLADVARELLDRVARLLEGRRREEA
jgi:phosphopantothenoylcysteine decarboxylase/phosphopantothenate--cysteine ligase